MATSSRSQLKDKFLYWGLSIYVICLFAISPKSGNPDQIRIPGFTLLLLFLIQVIFPNFRFSKLSNLIAIFIILGAAILSANLPHG